MADEKEFRDDRWVKIQADDTYGYVRKSAVVMITAEAPDRTGLRLESGESMLINANADDLMEKHFKSDWMPNGDVEPLLDGEVS